MNAINTNGNVEIITGTSGAQYVPMDFTPYPHTQQLPPPPAVVEISSTTPFTPHSHPKISWHRSAPCSRS